MQRFDGYEIRPVHEWAEEDGSNTCEAHETQAEVIESIADCGGRLIWTLYGHLPEGGVMAIYDGEDEQTCMDMLERITGVVGVPGQLIYKLRPSLTNRTLSSDEIATLLHALRLLQERESGPADCTFSICDHFDDADELMNEQIDVLCELLNVQDVMVTGLANGGTDVETT